MCRTDLTSYLPGWRLIIVNTRIKCTREIWKIEIENITMLTHVQVFSTRPCRWLWWRVAACLNVSGHPSKDYLGSHLSLFLEGQENNPGGIIAKNKSKPLFWTPSTILILFNTVWIKYRVFHWVFHWLFLLGFWLLRVKITGFYWVFCYDIIGVTGLLIFLNLVYLLTDRSFPFSRNYWMSMEMGFDVNHFHSPVVTGLKMSQPLQDTLPSYIRVSYPLVRSCSSVISFPPSHSPMHPQVLVTDPLLLVVVDDAHASKVAISEDSTVGIYLYCTYSKYSIQV